MPTSVSRIISAKVKENLIDLCRDVIFVDENGSWPQDSLYSRVAEELYPLCSGVSRFDVRNLLENEVRMQAVRHLVQQADDLNSKPLTAYQLDVLKALHGMRNSTSELVDLSRKLHGKEYLRSCRALGKTLRGLVERNMIGIRAHGDGPHAATIFFLTREGRRCFNGQL